MAWIAKRNDLFKTVTGTDIVKVKAVDHVGGICQFTAWREEAVKFSANLNQNGAGVFVFPYGPGAGQTYDATDYALKEGAHFEFRIPPRVSNAFPRRVKMDKYLSDIIQEYGEPSTWPSRSANFRPEIDSEEEIEGVSIASFFMKSPSIVKKVSKI
jgi:hypothetical protein